MPDIVLPVVFVDGTATDADGLNRDFYDPAVAPDSFEVLDGRLTNPNRQAGWDIRAPQIMKRRLAWGRMVGATGVLDFVNYSFPNANTDALAYRAIPGGSITWQAFRTPTIVWLTWQLITATGETSETNPIEMRLFVDGVRMPGQFRVQPRGQLAGLRQTFTDRCWHGHWCNREAGAPALGVGWHTASLRLWHGSAAALRMTRCRIRNMKVLSCR